MRVAAALGLCEVVIRLRSNMIQMVQQLKQGLQWHPRTTAFTLSHTRATWCNRREMTVGEELNSRRPAREPQWHGNVRKPDL